MQCGFLLKFLYCSAVESVVLTFIVYADSLQSEFMEG